MLHQTLALIEAGANDERYHHLVLLAENNIDIKI